MQKRALITGITGFAGSHLAEHLLEQKKYEVYGTYLTSHSLRNIAQIKNAITLEQLDLIDAKKTSAFIALVKPDLIFHLAALSSVGVGFQKPVETMTNNIAGQINVLEAVISAGLKACRILVVSSADVYGRVSKDDLPIDENTPFMPTNTYAVSKIAQDFLGLQYFLSYDLAVIRARPFNHVGPRQAPGFVVSDFAKKIAEIEKGKIQPIVHVGNLDAKRDFTDVRDMVSAYTLLIEKGEIGQAYNIGSGISYKIANILNILISCSKCKITIQVDSNLLRPEEALDRVCDKTKIEKLIQWSPRIPIEKTLKDTLDYWRDII